MIDRATFDKFCDKLKFANCEVYESYSLIFDCPSLYAKKNDVTLYVIFKESSNDYKNKRLIYSFITGQRVIGNE